MGHRLFEHGHNRLRVIRNIRPEANGICVGGSAHDYLPWRVHRCFRQPAQCMPSLCPSRSTETSVVLCICIQSRSRTVACVVWRTGRRISMCEEVGYTSRTLLQLYFVRFFGDDIRLSKPFAVDER